MHINFDPAGDRLRFILKDRPVASGDEVRPGFHFYYDDRGEVVGFDIEEAAGRIDDPRQVEFTLED